MPKFEDWEFESPEFSASAAEERAYAWDVMKTGFRFLIFTSLLYTFSIWGIAKILLRNDILSGEIKWTDAGLIAFGIVFLRIWNRAFFK